MLADLPRPELLLLYVLGSTNRERGPNRVMRVQLR